MWKKFGLGFLAVILLCAASSAAAQMSRHAFEAVAHEKLIIELEDGQILEGELRHVDDEYAVVLSEAGDIYDISLAKVQRLRVDRTASKNHSDLNKDPTIKTSSGQPAARSQDPSGYFDAPQSEGYFPPPASIAPHNPYRGDPPETSYQAHNGLRLSYEDFAYYQAMIDESRNKRVIGWSMFATGAGLLMIMAMQVHDAREMNTKPRVGSIAAVGAITTAIGLPVAIAGRQQYRRAGVFAQEAAQARRALEEAALQKSREKANQNTQKEAPAARENTSVAPSNPQPNKADSTALE